MTPEYLKDLVEMKQSNYFFRYENNCDLMPHMMAQVNPQTIFLIWFSMLFVLCQFLY